MFRSKRSKVHSQKRLFDQFLAITCLFWRWTIDVPWSSRRPLLWGNLFYFSVGIWFWNFSVSWTLQALCLVPPSSCPASFCPSPLAVLHAFLHAFLHAISEHVCHITAILSVNTFAIHADTYIYGNILILENVLLPETKNMLLSRYNKRFELASDLNWTVSTLIFKVPGVLRRNESLCLLEACSGRLARQYFSK